MMHQDYENKGRGAGKPGPNTTWVVVVMDNDRSFGVYVEATGFEHIEFQCRKLVGRDGVLCQLGKNEWRYKVTSDGS